MTDREVMQLALEAWDSTVLPVANDGMMQERMEILRETLEQPEQHPVAFVNADHLQGLTLGHYGYAEIYTDESEGRVPVYTTPPPAAQPEQVDCPRCGHVCSQRKWVGLTPEEILDLFDRNNVYGSKWIEFARTVEAKLKEKNT